MVSAGVAVALDVVIVNWYAWAALRRCVEHVRDAVARFTPGHAMGGARVVVVDNSLTPMPAALAAWLDGKAELIRPGSNVGFGAACNLGAARGEAPAILFLNADAWPHRDALSAIAARLAGEGVPGTPPAIVGGRMLDLGGAVVSSCWRFPSVGRLTAEALGLDRLRPSRGWGCRLRDADYDVLQPVDQVIGALLAIRRDVFEAHGGFDERFFLYYEEVDLCRRVRNSGYEVVFDPSIVFTHAHQPASGSTLAPRLAYNSHSRIVYARKHWGRVGAVYVAGLAVAVEPTVRLVVSIFTKRGASFGATVRYLSRLWRGILVGGWRRSVALAGGEAADGLQREGGD